MAILFLVFGIAMGIGTFVESKYSTETARIWIYNAWWFEAIMLFFMINFFGNMFRYRLFRWEKWPVLVLHLSWVLIILGAFITRYISYEGMMPIREGSTENVFYSDKTYLTAYVDGKIDGKGMRKTIEREIMVTPEALKSDLPWQEDYNGKPFQVSYAGFIKGAKEGLVPDENGKYYLKIVEAGTGQREEHYLENGRVTDVHNVLFAVNQPTEGAINIFTTDSTYQIQSPFEGNFMRMADQFQGVVTKDSLQQFQLRSLYTMAGMQFVIPELLTRGSYGVVEIPENEITEGTKSALIVDVTVGDQTVQKKILGGKGTFDFAEPVEIEDLKFNLAYGSKLYTLPFSVQLNDFIAEKYPGTEKGYSSFMSKVTLKDDRPFDYDIFMNNILDHQGFRFFQASFDPDEKGTILSVNHDQWGTWITYLGYFLLYIGLMGIMFFGKTRFKDLQSSLDKLKGKQTVLSIVFVLGLFLNLNAQEASAHSDDTHAMIMPTKAQVDSVIATTLVSKEHAEKFASLVIQDDEGRMKPIHTFSSELLRKISFKDTYKEMTADQVFLSMMLNAPVWFNAEFIALDRKGKNDSIRKVIGVPEDQEYVKAIDFFDRKGGNKLEPYLDDAFNTISPNKFQKDYIDSYLRLSVLNRALSGEILKIFPLTNDENNKWISAVDYRGETYEIPDEGYGKFVQNAIPVYLQTLQKAIKSGDYTQADQLLSYLKKNQTKLGSEVMPTEDKIKTEIVYNKLNIFHWLYRFYALIGSLLFFVLIFQIFKDRKIWQAIIYILKGIIIILFLWHTAGLILRWFISGHAPWSNAYESILYVAWATVGIGMLFIRKSNLTLAAATFVASMFLFIANENWVDPAISNLVPVLDSYWLMIHVAVIVGSYGPLTVGMILGAVCLLLMILTTKKNKKRMDIKLKELTIINEMALTVGLIMLTIGNFLGGQWANESWGRYWGWDPKETWALISIMVYAFILHLRLVPGLRGRWTFNFLSVFGYSSIMMTYFGVNYYLVGLHSYGQSGAAAITPDYVKYIFLGLFIFGGISLWRYKINYPKKRKQI